MTQADQDRLQKLDNPALAYLLINAKTREDLDLINAEFARRGIAPVR